LTYTQWMASPEQKISYCNTVLVRWLKQQVDLFLKLFVLENNSEVFLWYIFMICVPSINVIGQIRFLADGSCQHWRLCFQGVFWLSVLKSGYRCANLEETRLCRKCLIFETMLCTQMRGACTWIASAVAFAENFHGVVLSVEYGGHLYLLFALCDVTIWCHIHLSKPTFWRSLLRYYAYSSTRTPFNLCVMVLNINYQHSRLGYRRK